IGPSVKQPRKKRLREDAAGAQEARGRQSIHIMRDSLSLWERAGGEGASVARRWQRRQLGQRPHAEILQTLGREREQRRVANALATSHLSDQISAKQGSHRAVG